MNQLSKLTLTAAVVATALSLASPVRAEKHDSNTLHKLGNAIQYPIRKAGENISQGVHRAEHKKSVDTDRGEHLKTVITPKGEHIVKSTTSGQPLHHAYRHHRRHRHHHHTM